MFLEHKKDIASFILDVAESTEDVRGRSGTRKDDGVLLEVFSGVHLLKNRNLYTGDPQKTITYGL